MNKKEVGDLWRSFPHTVGVKLSKRKWIDYYYLKLISKTIATGIAKGNLNLLVEAPPRHGKSELISHWTPVWFLENFPEKSVIVSSYESSLAQSFGRKVRNEFESGDLLKTKLSQDSAAANRFNTEQGGGMVTAGVGGPLTGKGGHLIIVDDPYKNKEEAYSPNRRAIVADWFDWVLKTRREPGGSIVVLMTRWHQDDIMGTIMASNQSSNWQRITLPAIAEENDQVGRKPGEPLCPERYSIDDLNAIKADQPPSVWSALYQQRPSPELGTLVKRTDFKFWKELPARFDRMITSWDMTFKETQAGSFVVGQVWGKHGANKYLVDQVRMRTEFVGAKQAVQTLHAKYPDAQPILIEDKANGPAIISALKNEIPGIVPHDARGSKFARFEACSPQFTAGNVYVPDPSIAPWVHDYIEELIAFPSAPHDDQVDATSQALTYMASRDAIFPVDAVPSRIKSMTSRNSGRGQPQW